MIYRNHLDGQPSVLVGGGHRDLDDAAEKSHCQHRKIAIARAHNLLHQGCGNDSYDAGPVHRLDDLYPYPVGIHRLFGFVSNAETL